MKLPSRIVKSRHGVFYLRTQRFGIDKRFSLRTRDPLMASLAAYEFGVRIVGMDIDKLKNITDEEIKRWTIKTSGDDLEISTDGTEADHKRALEAVKLMLEARSNRYQEPKKPSESQQASINAAMATFNSTTTTLRWALDVYLRELHKNKNTKKTNGMAETALERVCEWLHADFDMQNFNDELIDKLWMQPRLQQVKANTVKRELSSVREFAKWASASSRKYCPAPLNLSISAGDDHWEYFNDEDLKAIFEKLPTQVEEPWHFWIPVIGLYTGARIGEIAALETKHFFNKTAMRVMHLPGTKTECAPRDVPIHADLIDLGLIDYVNIQKQSGKTTIFELKKSGQNGYGGKPSKWFGSFLREAVGIKNDRKVFHSFRHTIVDHLRQHGSDVEARMQYVGHSTGRGVHNAVYGRQPLGLQALHDRVVSKIDWQQYYGWSLNIPELSTFAKRFL